MLVRVCVCVRVCVFVCVCVCVVYIIRVVTDRLRAPLHMWMGEGLYVGRCLLHTRPSKLETQA